MGMRSGSDNESIMVVTVKKEALLGILQKNLKAHVEEFNTACGIYRTKVLEEAKDSIDKLIVYMEAFEKADFDNPPKYPDIYLRLPKPLSYAKHYERAIGMLELHSKDEMTLDISTYQKYVEDDWEWSSSAKMSNSFYTTSSAR